MCGNSQVEAKLLPTAAPCHTHESQCVKMTAQGDVSCLLPSKNLDLFQNYIQTCKDQIIPVIFVRLPYRYGMNRRIPLAIIKVRSPNCNSLRLSATTVVNMVHNNNPIPSSTCIVRTRTRRNSQSRTQPA